MAAIVKDQSEWSRYSRDSLISILSCKNLFGLSGSNHISNLEKLILYIYRMVSSNDNVAFMSWWAFTMYIRTIKQEQDDVTIE